MILSIGDVIAEDRRADVLALMSELDWQDGRTTAGRVAAKVKRNRQADLTTGNGAVLKAMLLEALNAHPVLKAAAQPKRFSKLLISRTGPGDYYGPHVDNAVMGAGKDRLRTDLSFTLGLSDPATYKGGELAIHLPGGTQTHRVGLGDLVLYPATEIHEVTEVTSAERIVCVGWIESRIRDEAAREVLFDLENLRSALRARPDTTDAERLTLDKAMANLQRLWAEV